MEAPPDDLPAIRDWAEQLMARAKADGIELTGEGGLLTDMAAMCCRPVSRSSWLTISAPTPYDPVGRGSGNSRNGAYPKTVATEIGEVELRMPRDRIEPLGLPR